MLPSQFNSANIVALLTERAKGGSTALVVERSGVNISATGVQRWIYQGRRDAENGKQTAYSKFAAQWDSFAKTVGMAARMAEMDKALEILEA